MQSILIKTKQKSFHDVIKKLNQTIYESYQLVIDNLEEEKQNSAHNGGRFRLTSNLNTKTIRFRVAKITPNKLGQFVSFWEKDKDGINQAFSYRDAPDLLVITTFKNENIFDQFAFLKEPLYDQGVLKSATINGKMAMRVYPSWDNPKNKTAIEAQLWQLNYFFIADDLNFPANQRILALYQL